MTITDEIRRWAVALPEVEEPSHFRFHTPVFKVRGRTFLGLGKDETTAVFCIGEQQADHAAAADLMSASLSGATTHERAFSDCKSSSVACRPNVSGA